MQKKSQQELETFINGIKEALHTFTPKELSEAIFQVLEKKGDKRAEIHFVLDSIANHHSISRRTLIHGSNRETTYLRKISYCLLYYDLKLTIPHISTKVFKKQWSAKVGQAVADFRRLDPDKVKADREFKEKYDLFQGKLQHFILQQREENPPSSSPTTGNAA